MGSSKRHEIRIFKLVRMIRAIKGELIGADPLQLEIKEGFLEECLELT